VAREGDCAEPEGVEKIVRATTETGIRRRRRRRDENMNDTFSVRSFPRSLREAEMGVQAERAGDED
jgi:hypothetical protein